MTLRPLRLIPPHRSMADEILMFASGVFCPGCIGESETQRLMDRGLKIQYCSWQHKAEDAEVSE